MQLDSRFGTVDYIVFAISLVISFGIGVYSIFAGKKKTKTTDDFSFGDRRLNYVAVALSMASTFLSAVGILGIPSEFYTFGASYGFMTWTRIIAHILTIFIFVPFFYDLGFTSMYEYFEHRFGRSIRQLTCLLYILNAFTYMAIVLYAPALSLSQASGLPIWAAILTGGVLCTIYTALGGIKAVIWTVRPCCQIFGCNMKAAVLLCTLHYAFQMVVMVVGLVAVAIMGTISSGGLLEIWGANQIEGRLSISFSPDPRIRHSFWSISTGAFFTYFTGVLSQSSLQRMLSVKSRRTAQKMWSVNAVISTVWDWILYFLGLTVYAYYRGCDPLLSNRMQRPDQIMALFVQDTLSFAKGFPGLFLSMVYCATLSTVSSGVNSIVVVLIEDFIKPAIKNPDHKLLREGSLVTLSKVLSFVIGALAIALAFGTSVLGKGLIQMCLTVSGLCGGPGIGVFICGFLLPYCNTKGALIGFLTGLLISFWIGIGAFIIKMPSHPFPVNADSCPAEWNLANSTMTLWPETTTVGIRFDAEESTVLPSFRPTEGAGINMVYALSYQYYSSIGVVMTVLTATIISFITGANTNTPERLLLYNVFKTKKHLSALESRDSCEYSSLDNIEIRQMEVKNSKG